FIPETILQQQVRGEFRHVTTLFLNLRDIYTHEQLAPFVQTIFKLIKTYGGYLNTIDFGDKGCTLLLFWGMPTSHENDIERVMNFVQDLSQQTQVTFRAGITYRLMYAGFVGAKQLRQEYSCYGRGVNLAARLMTTAPWGALWADEELMQRGQQQFHFTPQGHFSFKGFPELQPAYAYNGRREEANLHFHGRMIGRQVELAQMVEFVRPLQNGRFAGILIIQGEAGIGKSRLVDAFQRAPTWQQRFPQPPQWLHSQADEILRQALNPFRHLLHRYFQQVYGDTPAANQERFQRRLNALLHNPHIPPEKRDELRPKLTWARPFLGALIGQHMDNDLAPQMEGRAYFDNTLLALQTLIQAESTHRPLILHIADVHWLDETSWQCLRQLSRTLTNYPVAIILTTRNETTPAAMGLSEPTQTINLTSLSEAGLAELAMNLLGHPPSPRILKLLIERSDGNPFFAEQILLYLREQEFLQQDAPHLTAMLLPMDVRAILIARIDQLAQSVKEVVQRAAILGREFDIQLLSYLLRDMPDLHEKVYDAERASIWTAVNQLRYLFKHALLRDAAYDMQLKARRRELHRLTAAALEHLHARDLSPHYGELAYHYQQAKLDEQEGKYATLAGHQAVDRFAHEDALRYLNRALELTPASAGDKRFSLLLSREQVYHLTGKRERQEADLAALEELTAQTDNAEQKGTVWSRRARYADVVSDYQAEAAAGQAVINLALQVGDRALEGNGRMHYGIALWRQGHYPQAVEQLTQALTLSQQSGKQNDVITSRHFLGIIAYEQGDFAASKANYQELLTLRRALGDRVGEASTLNNLGAVANFQGDFAQARTHFQQALHIRRETGHRQGEGALLLNLGVIERNLGDYATAHAYLEQALPISREVNERMMECVVLANLALLHHQIGEQETAVAYSRHALDLVRSINSPLFHSAILTWLAHALTAREHYDEARQHYEEAITLRRSIGHTHLVIEPLAGLARIALATGNTHQAYAYGKEMRQILKENPSLNGTEEPIRIYLTCYHCLLAGQDVRAGQVLQTGYELLQQRAALYDDAQRITFLDISDHREMIQTWQNNNQQTVSQKR
ncbi:MAG: tetratricopeptide repeat protein, partial [Anaerolineales bacterium]|nr:tetratricopeptide repeat protein [Anaerolineales bacterium]